MPSGMVVTAKHSCFTEDNCYLDVTIFPLAEDFDHSEGLCGNFNGEKDDDRVPKGSTMNEDAREPIAFTTSYMSVNCFIQYFVQLFLIFRTSLVFTDSTNTGPGPDHTVHWLDVADRIRFRLCVQVYKCQHSMAAGYLAELCRPVSNIDSHRHLLSAGRGQLHIPQVRLSTYGGCAFSYVRPSVWNALPDFLKTIHFLCLLLDASLNISTSHFTSTPSAFEVILRLTRLINYLLSYLLTLYDLSVCSSLFSHLFQFWPFYSLININLVISGRSEDLQHAATLGAVER